MVEKKMKNEKKTEPQQRCFKKCVEEKGSKEKKNTKRKEEKKMMIQ